GCDRAVPVAAATRAAGQHGGLPQRSLCRLGHGLHRRPVVPGSDVRDPAASQDALAARGNRRRRPRVRLARRKARPDSLRGLLIYAFMPDNGIFSLDGDVAVVIGGGGVLAGAMAEGLAAAGARIAIGGRTRENAEARARVISEKGYEAIGIQCDATSKAELSATLDAVLERFGRVDVLVNAAGVNSATPFFEISEEEWHRILDIDL